MIVLVHLPVSPLPVIKLAGEDSDPSQKPGDINSRSSRPVPYEVHDRIPYIVWYPSGL